MPYKDKEAYNEYMRNRRKPVNPDGVNPANVNPKQPDNVNPNVTLLSRPNGNDYDPTEKLYNNPHYPDGTFRYLGPLSDGQVLDRLTVPT